MKNTMASQWIFVAFVIALMLFAFANSSADTIHYEYDAIDRLIRSENATTGQVVEYQYDAVGNRTTKQTTPATGGIVPFRVTVRKDAQNPLPGVNAFLFDSNGTYLGSRGVSDEEGLTQFDVTRGTYRVRADYMGYQFWSDAVSITSATNIDLVIPHQPVDIIVNSSYQGTRMPVPGVQVYLFTPSGSYLGLSQQTGDEGQVSFSLPARDYKARADYMSQQYFSSVFNAQDAAIDIPLADAELTVIQGGLAIGGVKVYVFTSSGSYLGINGVTDGDGTVTFRLPAATYKFRTDCLGNQYWSSLDPLVADQATPIAVDTGGGMVTLTVLKGASAPLSGVACYVFNETGSYLGISRTSDSNGRVSCNLANGRYRFRLDYLGSQFWTDVLAVPETMSLSRTIDHRAVAVTVMESLAGSQRLKSGIPAYLFSPSGSYLSLNTATDGNGRATFNLPQQPYKVRADYLGQQFWSEIFTWEDETILIPEGTARVHITMAGQGIQNVPAYVFTSGGSYLGITSTSNASGTVDFSLPSGNYRFRADYLGSQYWATAEVDNDVINAVEINMGDGRFTLAIDKGSEPLSGVRVYAFNPAGSYLGTYRDSDASGQVRFDLSGGSYKFRVDVLGYPFWSNVFTLPGAISGTFSIPHQNLAVTVERTYPESQPVAGVKVYLFTPSGSYLGKTQTTDSGGHAAFSLPDRPYMIRADYLGYQFWSGVFQFQNATVGIPCGVAQITAEKGGNPVPGVPVYLFSNGGSYLGLNIRTNAEGKADFLLPNRAYKFRADADGAQHWSAVTTIAEGEINPIGVNWD